MADLTVAADLVRDSERAFAQVILVLASAKSQLAENDSHRLAQMCGEAEVVLSDMLFAAGCVASWNDLAALLHSVAMEKDAEAANTTLIVPSRRIHRMN